MNEELKGIIQKMIDNNESQETINAVIAEYERRNASDVQEGKTDAAAEETATVVADQPIGLDLQSENGLLEQPEDDEGFFEGLYNVASKGYASAGATGETLDIMSSGYKSDAELLEYIEAKEEARSAENIIKSQQEFAEKVEKYKQEGDNGFLAGFKAFADDPSMGIDVMVSSFAGQVRAAQEAPGIVAATTAAGAATGSFIPVLGTVSGGLAGARLSSMAVMEAQATFSELLDEKMQEQGLNLKSTADLRKVLEDEDTMDDIRRKAVGRGLTIGTIEAIFGKLAGSTGKIVNKASRLSKVGGAVGAVGIEAAGGMVGETAGMLVAGQELAGEEILLEGIAGTVFAPAQIAAAGLDSKAEYRLNGEKLNNKKAINEVVENSSDEDFVNTKINVKKDKELSDRIQERRKNIIRNNKQAVKDKIAPKQADELKAKINAAIKTSEIQLKEVKDTDGELAAEAIEIRIKTLKQQLEELDNHINFQLDELNEDETLSLMNMDDDVSLYQSILNDPNSSEAAKKSAEEQLLILKAAQINVLNNTDSADLANPDGPRKQKNIDLSQKTQEAYEKGGVNNYGEIAEHQIGTIRSIATSLWSRVAEDKKIGTYDDFVAALISEPSGLRDMVKSYDPTLGVPLAAYIGDRKKGLRVRANRIIKKLTKQDVQQSTDSTEALNQFGDEIDIDSMDLGPRFNYERLGLGKVLGNLESDVEIGLQKTINELEKLGEVTQKKRQSESEKAFNSIFKNKYDKIIKDFVGKNTKTSKDFTEFIDKNFDTLKRIALNNIDFQKGGGISNTWNTYAPSKQDFIDYYEGKDIAPNKPASVKSDRKKSLINAIVADLSKSAREAYFETRPDEQKAFNIEQQISFQEAGVKKIRIFDFDDTLAKSNSQVLYTLPDGTTGKLNATEYAKRDQELKDAGATFDFSEFSKVIDGKKGPLFEVAQKINAARGNEDLFVLTARPADAAGPIQEFLKLAGLDFKKENIIGLGDGTAQAKADWVQGKINEGYNDFYFADDAIKNVEAVKNVLDNADVKGKVQQAKAYQDVLSEIVEQVALLYTADSSPLIFENPISNQANYMKYTLNEVVPYVDHNNTEPVDVNKPEGLKKAVEGLKNIASKGFLSLNHMVNMANAGRKEVRGTKTNGLEVGVKFYEMNSKVEGSILVKGKHYLKRPADKKFRDGVEYLNKYKGKFKPSDGNVFYGKSDPNFEAVEKVAKENYSGAEIKKQGALNLFTKTKNIIVNKVVSLNIFKELVEKHRPKAKINQELVKQMTIDYGNAVKNGANPYIAGLMLKSGYASTSGAIKTSYEFKGFENGNLEFGESLKFTEKYKGNSKRRVREEHSPPVGTFTGKLLKLAVLAPEQSIGLTIDQMYKDAGQYLVSFKHDEMIDNGGLASSIMPGSSIGYGSSILRLLKAGIPPAKITTLDPITENVLRLESIKSIGLPDIIAEGALSNLSQESANQSAVQMQENLSPDPKLTNNEAIEALSDMLGTIYGINVITGSKEKARKALQDVGYAKEDIEFALKQMGFNDPNSGIIYINSEKAGLDTPMHEFTHAWAEIVNKKDPNLFNAIYDKLKSHPLYGKAVDRMAKGKTYSKLSPDSFGYKNEIMAFILGEEGKSLYEVFEGDAEAKSLIDKFFDYVREALGFDPTIKNFADLTVDQVVKLAVKDMLEGNPSANFNKLQNVAKGKSWYAKSEATQSPSAKAKSDPIVRAFNKLKLSYRENKNLAQAINDAYSEVENLMDFVDFVKLVFRNTKEIKTGKTNQLLIAKAEIIKADKIAEENAKKQAEQKLSDDQASKLQSMFRRIIYQAKGEGAKASRWFIPPNAEDFKGLLYAFLPKGQLGVDARKWMEEHLIKPYSNGIATLDTEILHKSKAWTDMSKGFNFEEKVGGTPYTLGDAIKVYNALKEGVDPGIAKKKHLDALIHAVESNSEVLDLANEVAESFPIKLESGWQTRAFAKEIYDSINNGARKRHLETFSNNVDAVFTDATLDLIADQYGEKYRQAIVSTLRRMKSGRNRVSTDANANSYMNWLNRAVGTTMFLNTRSAILQLLSTLNFIGKPGNNIFQATAAFANQKQWKADYNKLWNSDYLANRRDGAKFDVLADEIAEGPQGLNKILKFGFLPTRYADSFAIALGGAAYYRNRVNMLMKEGMSEADAEAQAMIDWRNTAEESQQSSDPSKISEIQASSIGKIIYAFANTPFQYARITKRKLQDIASGRSAAAGTLRTDMQSILYYSVGQAIMFNALQSGLVALLNSDDPEDEELKEEKYALLLERTLTSFAKSTGNPGAVASTLYAMMKEGYMQQTGQKRPDPNAFAITATSISPPLNSKIRDLAGAYRAFNKIDEGDAFTPSLDNEALTMAGEVASFGGIPLDRVIRKARHLAAIKNEEAELWQKIWMLAGWSSWELGVKESKDTEFKAIDFKDVDFKEVEFKESAFKKLEDGIAGRANKDGTIEIDPNLSPVERTKTFFHENQHQDDMNTIMSNGKPMLDYDDKYVYWKNGKYERKNGKIIYKGKSYIEGHPSLPWEKKAYDAEPSTKEIKRKKLYA